MSAVQDTLVQEWVDRLAIQDLIFRYCDSVTRGDYEHTATLFAPDAICEEQGGMRFESAREFIDVSSTSASHFQSSPTCRTPAQAIGDQAEAP